ncbi:hypothetical protein [Wenzhouxiangella marina]|uniref:Uncharacterized protein n=1 Tax=Wenzhouxiangella marina TaxID=1579979 RepID=A0A0K0XW73_9GAMM|nr:hypothetical protein [Wenzhouxiangella marina]AKS41866.1 hypothetical protein WM2015_1495 [Wenzhouxiangella marina]MBB6086368.1 hypothetical protein [Wenzhouxiangella marina]
MSVAKAPGLPPAGRFALAAALCSSLGQTSFIGLFGAEFRAAFDLSQSALGALYGAAQLGMIRGVYAALMVLSTAAGPVGLGLLFDWQVSLLAMALVYLAYALFMPLWMVPGIRASAIFKPC